MPNTKRIDHLIARKAVLLHDGDLSDSSSLVNIIRSVQPDEIYNLAAQSHVQVSFDVPEYTGDVDELPQDTSRRRAYADWIRRGKKFGGARGVYIYDKKGKKED